MEKKDLKITTYKEKEGYVFISYSSDDSDEVFNEYVLPLQEKYGLRVFCDMDFQNRATQNWTTQMKENLEKAQVCIIFISDTYVSSYACLLEVLFATIKKIPIIKVMLKKPTEADDDTEREISGYTVKQFDIIGRRLEYEGFKEAASCYLDIVEYIENGKISKYHVSKAFIDYLPKIKGNHIQNANGLLAIKNSIEEVQNKESFYEVTKAEQLENVEKRVEPTEVSKEKEEASVTRGVNYVLYGEKYTGNHTEIMCKTFKKVLEKHPEFIDKAIEALSCLSKIDYSDKNKYEKVPGYFKACNTIDVHGRIICVGTNLVMEAKLKYVTRLLALVGENSDVLHIEGYELPDINLIKDSKCVSAEITEKRSDEKYLISGVMKEGNQAKMMWDVFEALAEKYADKIEKLTDFGFVKLAKDVQDANTKTAQPTAFISCKSFIVNGQEYLVAVSYNRAQKVKYIEKMISVCEAPSDFFILKEE